MKASDISDRAEAVFTTQRPTDPKTVATALREYGLAFFRCAAERETFVHLVNKIGDIEAHPHGDPDGVTRIQAAHTPSGAATRRGFSNEGLYPHTDRSSVSEPAEYLAQLSVRNAETGGQAVLVDGAELLRALQRDRPALLSTLQTRDSVIFGGDIRYQGAILEPRTNDRLRLRFRFDDFGYYGRSIASEISALVDAVGRYATNLEIPEGCGYIVDNLRWLHGRTAFSGGREMWRILFNGRRSSGLSPGIPSEIIGQSA